MFFEIARRVEESCVQGAQAVNGLYDDQMGEAGACS